MEGASLCVGAADMLPIAGIMRSALGACNWMPSEVVRRANPLISSKKEIRVKTETQCDVKVKKSQHFALPG